MTVVQFDTLECANKLKESGVSEEQANATIEVMKQALEAKDIATKQDVELESEKVRREIETSKAETVKWMAGMFVIQTGILIAVVIAAIKILSL